MKICYAYIDKFYNNDVSISLTKHEREHILGRKVTIDVAKSFYGIDDEIVIDGKRPHFKHNEIYFSISHSENIVAVVFDNCPVGIDVEFVKPRKLDKLIKRYNLDDKHQSLDDFYRWWTAYEAKYKNPSGKVISTFRILPEYICSISANEKCTLVPEEITF